MVRWRRTMTELSFASTIIGNEPRKSHSHLSLFCASHGSLIKSFRPKKINFNLDVQRTKLHQKLHIIFNDLFEWANDFFRVINNFNERIRPKPTQLLMYCRRGVVNSILNYCLNCSLGSWLHCLKEKLSFVWLNSAE